MAEDAQHCELCTFIKETIVKEDQDLEARSPSKFLLPEPTTQEEAMILRVRYLEWKLSMWDNGVRLKQFNDDVSKCENKLHDLQRTIGRASMSTCSIL